mmetsp:Transcript_107967/g.311176  ORF Transcript_107967/g.311176 Transcript_107967/m.311176 type:complete len:290 (+) Transcript_107967:899-1768(+)
MAGRYHIAQQHNPSANDDHHQAHNNEHIDVECQQCEDMVHFHRCPIFNGYHDGQHDRIHDGLRDHTYTSRRGHCHDCDDDHHHHRHDHRDRQSRDHGGEHVKHSEDIELDCFEQSQHIGQELHEFSESYDDCIPPRHEHDVRGQLCRWRRGDNSLPPRVAGLFTCGRQRRAPRSPGGPRGACARRRRCYRRRRRGYGSDSQMELGSPPQQHCRGGASGARGERHSLAGRFGHRAVTHPHGRRRGLLKCGGCCAPDFDRPGVSFVAAFWGARLGCAQQCLRPPVQRPATA